jgi:5,5'-dehydrodivanillate O-demethylase
MAREQVSVTELAKTGPGTLTGALFRRFWQPVAVGAEVHRGRAIPIKVLGEELTLYRGESGAPYIVAARCAHRLSLLHTGWVEGESIRCMYHGWRYEGSGQCIESPAEDPGFPAKIRITGYPAREYTGVIFAYLGVGEPPPFDLPRHPELERAGCIQWIQKQVWPCNWLQSVENSLDAVHVSFVHRWGNPGSFGAAVTDVVPKLEYLETESGIRQIATRGENNVRVSDWTFPNHNHIVMPGLHREDPWTHTVPWMVPIDDERVLRISSQASTVQGEASQRLEEYLLTHGYEPTGTPGEYFGRDSYSPEQHHEELFLRRACPEPLTNELVNAQDYVAQVGQGPMVDRTLERLGRSDAGVLFLRGLLLRELAALRDGRPPKQWTRSESVELPIQTGEARGAVGWDRQGVTKGALVSA